MAWRLAKSLVVLRGELNTIAPNRSTASDGTIGDDAHQSSASDHNPNGANVVCAADFTHDPGSGADMHRISRAIVKRLPRAIKYVIWNRQIWSRSRASEGWRPYTGSNPHTRHMHVSVGVGSDGHSTGPYDDLSPWGLGTSGGTDMSSIIDLKLGDSGSKTPALKQSILALQYNLVACGVDPGARDGEYGAKVAAAVLKVRKQMGSDAADGNRITGAAYDQIMCAMMRAQARKAGIGDGVTQAALAAEVAAFLKANPPKPGKDGKTPTKVRVLLDADVVAAS